MEMCPRCKEFYPSTEFVAGNGSRRRHCGTCQPVVNLHYNLRKYGIDIPTYEAMATAQDHECAICRTAEVDTGERLLLDHCHTTGKVRGLLCRNCNTGLARFKDSPAILGNAHAYIANALWDVGHDLTEFRQYLPRGK